MTYEEALEKVNQRLRFGMKPGLERIAELCEKLGNPHKKLRFVHVAGTNGKGTTCTLTASVLTKAGYRTGLYTSPYVLDFRERFQINGQMIPPEELIRAVETVTPVAEAMEAEGREITEFEFITALAFWWFAEQNCDFVVLEVGLGGRFDATNVIDAPMAAAIASISLDHTHILGDTVEKIAFEKAGIIKPGTDVALYAQQEPGVIEVFSQVCRERGATLHIAQTSSVTVENTDLLGTDILWNGLPLRIPFTGAHQVHNAATVLTVLEILRQRGVSIPDDAVQSGFAAAHIPARMEMLSASPLVLLDGGHNPGCAKALDQVLSRHMAGVRITAIMGMVADKDSLQYLALTAPHFEKIVTVAPNNPRALAAEALAEEARQFCSDVTAASSVEEALRLSAVNEKQALVICGSLYLSAEIRQPAIDFYKK